MSQSNGRDDTVKGADNVQVDKVQQPLPQDVHVKSHEDSSINGQDCAPPPVIYKRAVAAGKAKAEKSIVYSIPMGLLAGFFIAIGVYVAGAIGGSVSQGFNSFSNAEDPDLRLVANLSGIGSFLTGIYGLPIGLLAVVVFGADLFTGNCLTSFCALLEGVITPLQYLKTLTVSWFTNLFGSLLLVALARGANFIGGTQADAFQGLANGKTAVRDFGQLTAASILANFLVCMAVAQAQASGSFVSKVFATLLPVSAFVALGLEHSVANMAIIPMGMLFTNDVTVGDFLFQNLWLVTIGNFIGGGIMLGGVLSLAYGTPGQKLAEKIGM